MNFVMTRVLLFSLVAPKHQSENHYAKCTWQTVKYMAQGMLVHAHLPDSYLYHALLYALSVFNGLLGKALFDSEGDVMTPSFLFLGMKPLTSNFHVFGCLCIVKKWTVQVENPLVDNQDETQHGIWSIFIGFPKSQKGHMLYAPFSHQLVMSGNVAFNESFFLVITEIWQLFCCSLSLHQKHPTSPIQWCC